MAKRKISKHVIDESLLANQLNLLAGIEGVEITLDGRIKFPEGASFDQRVTILHGLVDAERVTSVSFRFLIGNCINALSAEHGDKAFIIQKEFGVREYDKIRKWARVAKGWAWNQGLPWTWSFYDETAGLSHEKQLYYLSKWQAQRGYTIDQLRAERAAEKGKTKCPTSDISDRESDPMYGVSKYIGSANVYMQANYEQRRLELLDYDEQPLASINQTTGVQMVAELLSMADAEGWDEYTDAYEAERQKRGGRS